MIHLYRGILTILFIATSFHGLAQTTAKEIANSYQLELNLTVSLEKKFSDILMKYKSKFDDKDLKIKNFNVLLKQEELEVHKILNPEQFRIYKELKKRIEPLKKYRFENN